MKRISMLFITGVLAVIILAGCSKDTDKTDDKESPAVKEGSSSILPSPDDTGSSPEITNAPGITEAPVTPEVATPDKSEKDKWYVANAYVREGKCTYNGKSLDMSRQTYKTKSGDIRAWTELTEDVRTATDLDEKSLKNFTTDLYIACMGTAEDQKFLTKYVSFLISEGIGKELIIKATTAEVIGERVK